MKLVLITGLSGAGKSVALRAMEDAGFEAIDNLPLPFLPVIVRAEDTARLAVAIDIRSRHFSPQRFASVLKMLKGEGSIECSLIYLDCQDEVLQRRFTETRRRHPLAADRPVMDGIQQERQMLDDLRALADVVVDTTDMTAPDLRRALDGMLGGDKKLSVTVTSFSYKRGLPREADLIFDVRFLKNPHYVAELKDRTGLDAPVGEYIRHDPSYDAFFRHLTQLITPLLPRYLEEGKTYLTFGIGCTGGQHRSVFVAEELSKFLRAQGLAVQTRHRELQRSGA